MDLVTALSLMYDIFTAIISVLDVVTDIIITTQFYQADRMSFFYTSLSIIVVAQIAYCIAFWWRYADVYSFCNSCSVFCIILPFAPIMSFIFYFTADRNSTLSRFLQRTLPSLTIPDDGQSARQRKDKKLQAFREWTHAKLYKHLGFILEAVVEAFPQSILQLTYIVHYHEHSALSIFSILLSMLSVSSKSLILCMSLSFNWRTAIFNWLGCVTDFFSCFVMVSFAFYTPSNDDNSISDDPFLVMRQIYAYKIACTVLPFAVWGSLGINLYWSMRLVDGRFMLGCCILFFVQLGWVVGLVLTILSMEIAGFALLANVISMKQGFAARINRDDGTMDFYRQILSFIRGACNSAPAISKSQDQAIRICCVNRVLYASLPDKNFAGCEASIRRHMVEYLDAHKTVGKETSRKHPYQEVELKEMRRIANAHPPENPSSTAEIVRTMLSQLVNFFRNDIMFECSAQLLIYVTLPIYLIGRVFNLFFPALIVIYLASQGIYVFALPSFQIAMLAVYLCLILSWSAAWIAMVFEQRIAWYILPGCDVCPAVPGVSQLYEKSDVLTQPIEAYYDSILTIPMITELCCHRFGEDIAQVIMAYFDSGSKQYDYRYLVQRDEDARLLKLLLLGPSKSGKSTIFKQLEDLHASDSVRRSRASVVRELIFSQLKSDVGMIQDFLDGFDEEDEEKTPPQTPFGISDETKEAMIRAQVPNESNLDPEDLKTIWRDDGVQELYTNYNKRVLGLLSDTAPYFFNALNRITASDFVPTAEDHLNVRQRTTGIVERKFRDWSMRVYDVGGSRSERKKWIHCFENVTAVVFVASLSSYNEKMFEDFSRNALCDSVELFDEIVNQQWFRDATMILFLNKRDIFEKKFAQVPITVCPLLSDFDDTTNNVDDAAEFIKRKFEERSRSDHHIFSHFGCALDLNNVSRVFDDIRHYVLRHTVQQGGLI